jgi:hypothetical protein
LLAALHLTRVKEGAGARLGRAPPPRPSEKAQLESASGGPSALMLLRSHGLPLARRARSSEPHVLKLTTETADHGAADPRTRHLLRSAGSLSFVVPDGSAWHGKGLCRRVVDLPRPSGIGSSSRRSETCDGYLRAG